VPIVAGFAALALAVMILRPTGSAEAAPPSAVAVLPLANLTGDPDRDYIGGGISASLITRLREFSGLRVIGRSALWGEAGGGTPYERARRLGADILLEGELRHSERDLLVQVNLIDVDSGVILWSEGFDGSHEELPALQARIERRLAEAIAIPLSSNEQRRLERDPTKSIPAYDYYLRGQKLLTDEADTQGAGAATEMFRQAIRLDPGFALAHVGLSEALWLSYRTTRSRDRLTEAEVAARQAMEIDPELAAAQVALARILRATGRVSASIAGLRQALDRHPRPEQAYQELAISYERVGDLEEAERCLRAAATIRSEDWFNWNSLGSLLERSGRYAEARDAFVTAAEAAPAEVGTPHENLAALTILEGRFDEAIEAYERIPRPIRDPVLASNIATAFYFSSRADKWDQAETYYRLAQRLAPDSPTIRRNLADLYVEVGRHDEALQNYREALRLVEERLRDDPSNHHLRLAGALYAAKAERCSTAMPTATELEAVLPATARNAHKLAQVYAICDRRDDALRMIRDAIDLGISNRIIAQEPEFIPLRADAEFLRLTADATEPRRRPNRP
jgi:TolB-like protein/Flp pilus assembly protein TadD